MTPPDPYARSGDRKTLYAVGGTLAAIALLLGGLFATGTLRLGGSAGAPVARATGKGPAPIARVEGRTPPPIAAVTDTRKVMPPEVREWLNWLAQIEREKRALTSAQTSEMATMKATLGMGGLSSAADVENMASAEGTFNNPLNKLRDSIGGWRQAWRDLDAKFRSRVPPAECEPIRDAFSGGLAEMDGQMGDIARAFEGLNADAGDVSAQATQAQTDVKAAGGQSKTTIDRGFERTNEAVAAICGKYGEKPWFDIDAKGAAGGLFSSGL